jgi:hypothetical protein
VLEVADAQLHDRAHPGEAKQHHADECPISQAHDVARIDPLEQCAGLLKLEDGRLALLLGVAGPSDGGVGGYDVAPTRVAL